MLAIRGAFVLLVLAPLIYGVYYPQPYLNQILRKVPIAVVDNDLSELSRRIVETLDASGAVQVIVRAVRLSRRARRAIAAKPSQWSASRRGPNATCSRARLCICRSMSMRRTFSSSGRFPAASLPPSTRCRRSSLPAALVTDSSLVQAKLAAGSPTDILLQPVFNPVGGYASYVVPAAFVLILQQTLLIGAAMLTGIALMQPAGGAFASVLGRGIAHLTIYLPALALYFVVLPRFYGFSTLGSARAIVRAGVAVHPGD